VTMNSNDLSKCFLTVLVSPVPAKKDNLGISTVPTVSNNRRQIFTILMDVL
jgi:hypothetical protein